MGEKGGGGGGGRTGGSHGEGGEGEGGPDGRQPWGRRGRGRGRAANATTSRTRCAGAAGPTRTTSRRPPALCAGTLRRARGPTTGGRSPSAAGPRGRAA